MNEEGVITLSLEEDFGDSQLRIIMKMIIMLRIIVVVIIIVGTTFGRYHEKTRFDRSLTSQEEMSSLEGEYIKPKIFIDNIMGYVAYNYAEKSTCYLEKTQDDQKEFIIIRKLRPRVLYPSSLSLTNVEARKIVGDRIIDFCGGNSIKILQEISSILPNAKDPFSNEIAIDESHVIKKRVSDVILMPLISRSKREIILEKQKNLNQQIVRTPRQTYRHGGKFRGQTQSQYLNNGGDGVKEGKAEAEATDQSSRALVSGSNGMGQAQSMSSGGLGCEDCVNYLGSFGLGERGVQPSPVIPGSYSGGIISQSGQPGMQFPSYISGSGPGSTTTYPGAAYPSGVQQPGITISGGQPGFPLSYPIGVPPSGIPSVSTTYPIGAQQPGILGGTPGLSTTYPGSIPSSGVSSVPVLQRPDGAIFSNTPTTYSPGMQQPGRMVPGNTPGLPRIYPSGPQQTDPSVPSINTGIPGLYSTGTQYPGAYPTGVQHPSDIIPSSIPGSYPTGVQQPGIMIPGNIPSVSRTYPNAPQQPGSSMPSINFGVSGLYPTDTQYSRSYPLNQQVLGGVIPSRIPGSYPNGVLHPGTVIPGSIPGIPGSYPTGPQHQGGTVASTVPGSYPNGVQQSDTATPGTISSVPGSYPIGPEHQGGTVVSTVPGSYPNGVQQPGTVIPGTIPSLAGSYPIGPQSPVGTVPNIIPGTPGLYPFGSQQSGSYPGIQQPGGMIPGSVPGVSVPYFINVQHPGGVIPGSMPGSHPTGVTHPNIPGSHPTGVTQPSIPGSYPTGVTQPSVPGLYPPGTQQPALFPGSIPGVPGSYSPGIQHSGVIPVSIPGGTGIYSPGIQQPGGVIPGGIPGITGIYQPGMGQTDGMVPGSMPGISGIYPTGIQQPGGTIPGTVPGTAAVVDDGADSHASSSVKQTDNGTQATASADGKFGTGAAQSQVSGVYSGSGSFSAQAGTNDGNKGAQTQVSGGKEGAMSNAQGMGGQGKSQAQVQLNSDTGATITGAQSTGWSHGTNSQVQASAKGGMADAQANGEGSTSSQAQIGFQPYLGSKEKEKDRLKPFRGGGQASAQSGTYRGQSQSQIDGSFQYGITYTGAAQAGSGSGAGASRKPFNFTNSNPNLFKSFEKYDPIEIGKNDESTTVSSDTNDLSVDKSIRSVSSSRKTIIAKSHFIPEEPIESLSDHPPYDQEIEEYENSEEYEDEDYDMSAPSRINSDMVKTRSGSESSRQIQTINVGKDKKYNVHIIQDNSKHRVGDILQPGHTLPGYTIPSGFRGRVTSVSGEHTQSHGNGKSQAQTVSLSTNSQDHVQVGKSINLESKSLNNESDNGSSSHGVSLGNHNSSTRKMSGSTRSMSGQPVKPNYFTVTKSIAGKLGDLRPKYEHRYYTKSSTCGYFTFSCNIVHGSNGRTKICKPKMPTYPDGTPMKC